jgi:hypothetical protein
LPRHTVVALPVEWWRCHNTVYEDTSIAQKTKHISYFTAENQASFVCIERFICDDVRLKDLLREHDGVLG